MRYRALGRSGLMVSVVGLGCNRFGLVCDVDQTRAVVDAALDAGVTLLDTADTYGSAPGRSEETLGHALKGRREEVVLATKFGLDAGGLNGPDWGARGSRRYIRRAIEGSLARLRTDYVDLFQYHSPDGITPFEETLAALDELVKEGKVRAIGSSNLAAWQVVEADAVALRDGLTPFVAAQNEYSLLDRRAEAELVPACLARGVGILPYYPLAQGMLTGKYRRGEPPPEGTRLAGRTQLLRDESFDVVEALERFAGDRGRSLLDVAVGGLAARPAVGSVIAGATRPEQVRANAAAGGWEPSAEDMAALDEILG